MKNTIKARIVPLFGIIAVAAVIGFGMISCEEAADEGDPLDELTATERWWSFTDETSPATVTHSVNSDDECTITVTGEAITAPAGEHLYDHLWKAQAGYSYTAKAGKIYTYTFEAWTDSGQRKMNVQWYEDNDNKIYDDTGYEGEILNETPRFTITSERKTYALTGKKNIPKSGEQSVRFYCANQLGTFHVKIISIKEANNEGKKITITGLTEKTGNVYIMVTDDNYIVAEGEGSISGNAVTFNLEAPVNIGDEKNEYWVIIGSGNPWTGSGEYYLHLGFVENIYEYFYLNGKTEPQKYTISSPTSTIPFSKFGRLGGGNGEDGTSIDNKNPGGGGGNGPGQPPPILTEP